MLQNLKRTARQLLLLKRSLPPYLHWKRKLGSDPLFDLSIIDRGLEARSTAPSQTPEDRTRIAERIIKAYQLASQDQERQPAVYKVSNEWVPIFRKPLRPLLDALERGDAIRLRDLLDNFFRGEISQGLIGLANDMHKLFFERRPSRYMRTQLLIDSVYRYRLLQRLMPGTKAADLHIADFGNPYGMYDDGQFIRTGVDYQYFYAKKIAGILPSIDQRATVAELGGGIGGFAYFLHKQRPTNLTYVNLDLPEILCISSYQLLNLLPEKTALLYGEIDRIDSSTITEYDIALLPSFLIEKLGDDSVDATFNSYSLAEMDHDTISNYAKQMSRISRSTIFHVNHVKDSVVSADNFAFDERKFELRSRTAALWNLGRNLKCDEYEFLLTRKT